MFIDELFDLEKLGEMKDEEFLRLPLRCKCGYPIDISDSLRISKCSNPRCYYRMAEQCLLLLKDLNIKNVGLQTCFEWCTRGEFITPIEILDKNKIKEISVRATNYKQQLENAEIEYWKLYYHSHIFPSIKEGWRDIIGTATNVNEIEMEHLEKIYQDKIFQEGVLIDIYTEGIKKIYQRSNTVLEITLTGSIRGFKNRNLFIGHLNERYGDYYTFKAVGKKGAAHLLVTDSDMSGHEKFENAKRKGVPILTSEQLKSLLEQDKLDLFLRETLKYRKGVVPL